jgi:hypothetical protein
MPIICTTRSSVQLKQNPQRRPPSFGSRTLTVHQWRDLLLSTAFFFDFQLANGAGNTQEQEPLATLRLERKSKNVLPSCTPA